MSPIQEAMRFLSSPSDVSNGTAIFICLVVLMQFAGNWFVMRIMGRRIQELEGQRR